MTDVGLVLNAGSSSSKFSTFAVEGGRDLARRHRGGIEDGPVSVWVIPMDEELMIARHILAHIRRGGAR